MIRRRSFVASLSLPALWPVASPSIAAGAVVEGVRFAETASVGGSPLKLNGAGLRERYIKLFAAALYLAQPARSEAEVQNAAGPKRLRMVMLHDAPGAELAKAIVKQVGRNVAAPEMAALRERLDRFSATASAIGDVKKRDVIDLDFDPARGSTLMLNGTLRGEPIAGADFHAALLATFVGQRPFDAVLKAALLGTKPN